MKKNLFVFTALIIAISACSNEDNLSPNVDKEVKQTLEQAKSYQIPLENALLNLENILDVIDKQSNGNGSKVKSAHRSVKSVETVSCKQSINTSSGMNRVISPTSAEAMMYLVNFDNNQGYAVLAADERISSKVISIVDEGSISSNDFQISNNEISLEEEGLENFSLYNAESNDYYVGALALIEQKTLAKELMYEYAEREVNDYVEATPPVNSYSTSSITDPWIVTEKIYPMLTTLWHQRSPFNDNTPMRGWFNNKVHAPAGCVPVAVAQIMAYHEYPQTMTFNNLSCNWEKIKSNYNIIYIT